MKEPSRTPRQVSSLSAQRLKASNRVDCHTVVSTVCDCLLRLDLTAVVIISSWVLTVLVILVTKSVICAFNTSCLLFLPWICLVSIPSQIECSSQIIIFTMFLHNILQSWTFRAISSSKNFLQRDAVSFFAAWCSFQAIFSFYSAAKEV